MKLIAPEYYKDFHCIADRCRHSCCRGWEIDIDWDSYRRYRKVPGSIGARLRESMEKNERGEAAPAHFRLDENEKCPFLNDRGLCDLILETGEESLCQICRDHPRFRNYWSDRTEIGLGMACEEAARLILSQQGKVKLIVLEEGVQKQEKRQQLQKKERGLLDLRTELTEILQDRSGKTDDRVLRMLAFCDVPEGQTRLQFEPGPLNEPACEQLAVYLLYRHLADALYDGKLTERICFVAESYCRVRNCWAGAGKTDVESLVEPARAFSEAVEYDTDTWGIMQ